MTKKPFSFANSDVRELFTREEKEFRLRRGEQQVAANKVKADSNAAIAKIDAAITNFNNGIIGRDDFFNAINLSDNFPIDISVDINAWAASAKSLINQKSSEARAQIAAQPSSNSAAIADSASSYFSARVSNFQTSTETVLQVIFGLETNYQDFPLPNVAEIIVDSLQQLRNQTQLLAMDNNSYSTNESNIVNIITQIGNDSQRNIDGVIVETTTTLSPNNTVNASLPAPSATQKIESSSSEIFYDALSSFPEPSPSASADDIFYDASSYLPEPSPSVSKSSSDSASPKASSSMNKDLQNSSAFESSSVFVSASAIPEPSPSLGEDELSSVFVLPSPTPAVNQSSSTSTATTTTYPLMSRLQEIIEQSKEYLSSSYLYWKEKFVADHGMFLQTKLGFNNSESNSIISNPLIRLENSTIAEIEQQASDLQQEIIDSGQNSNVSYVEEQISNFKKQTKFLNTKFNITSENLDLSLSNIESGFYSLENEIFYIAGDIINSNSTQNSNITRESLEEKIRDESNILGSVRDFFQNIYSSLFGINSNSTTIDQIDNINSDWQDLSNDISLAINNAANNYLHQANQTSTTIAPSTSSSSKLPVPTSASSFGLNSTESSSFSRYPQSSSIFIAASPTPFVSPTPAIGGNGGQNTQSSSSEVASVTVSTAVGAGVGVVLVGLLAVACHFYGKNNKNNQAANSGQHGDALEIYRMGVMDGQLRMARTPYNSGTAADYRNLNLTNVASEGDFIDDDLDPSRHERDGYIEVSVASVGAKYPSSAPHRSRAGSLSSYNGLLGTPV